MVIATLMELEMDLSDDILGAIIDKVSILLDFLIFLVEHACS